ncbi:MAG: hypothetical protein QOF21_2350 [Actinomycetota bacterium]
MQTRRWVNQSQPQTLVIATFLLYFGAVIALINSSSTGLGIALLGRSLNQFDNIELVENFARLFIVVGGVAAGYLIANERKLGYFLGVATAALPLVAKLLIVVRFRVSPLDFELVNLLFEVALLALLLHEQTRNYIRIWFK